MASARTPFTTCHHHRRHWFTRYGQVGSRSPFCQHCGSPNPTCTLCGARTDLVHGGLATRCRGCGHVTDPADNPMRRP